MATKTSHLGLTKPVYAERADVQAINGNMDILDKEVAKRTNVKNMLVNSNFLDPVNQRGASSVTTNWTYFIDKWQVTSASASTPISVSSDGLTISNKAGTATMSLRQHIKNIPSGTYTAAANANGVVYWRVFTVTDGAVSIGASGFDDKGQIYISMTNGTLYYNLQAFAGNDITFKWATLYEGIYTAETLPPYVPKDKKVEMINCGVPLQPVNLLDNSDFRNPVHQRGQTQYTGLNTYTIDRWYVGGNNNKVTVGNGIVKSETTVGSSYATIAQKVANCTQYAGKTLTFAACVRSNVTPRIYVYNGNTGIKAVEGVSGDYQVLVCTFTVPANISDGALIVMLQSKSTTVGDYVEVQWAALYEGAYTADTLPAYQPKGYAAELMECMRYYIRYTTDTDSMFLPGGSNHNTFYATLHLPVPMRIDSPTVKYNNVNLYAYISGSAITINGITAPSNSATHGFVTLRATHDTDAIAAGAPGCIRILAGGYIELSADL